MRDRQETGEDDVGLLTRDTGVPLRPGVADLAAPTAPSGLSPAEVAVNLHSRILYLRSYLLMRAIIGFIGVSLPIVLIVGDNLLDRGAPTVRGALSDYYYSGLRDFFVGSLFAAAVFLITYKVFERSLSNVLTVVAGLAAFALALFPTHRPEGVTTALTPIQDLLGESAASKVHFTSSAIFIVSLAVISFFFGLQEGRRTQQRAGRRARMSPRFWRWFHWAAAAIILLAVTFILVTDKTRLTPYSRLIGEVTAVVAFGLSWLVKGLELDVLLGPRQARRRWERQAAAQTP
jgi:hypothetical protein